MTKPTKWEMPACRKCGPSAKGMYYVSFCRQWVAGHCMNCGDNLAHAQIIQGSAPPFVPMSDRPVPIYWSERLGGWDIFPLDPVPDDMDLCAYHWMIEGYENRLAHLCGLIARRRERQIHNYLVREPIADFEKVDDPLKFRIAMGLLTPRRTINLRFALWAMRGGAESHIYQQKFTALRGAALRGKA